MTERRKKKPFIERDISWMYFNRRILQEACRDNVPLLERMIFLGIYSNNLDEFFRVRVASQSRIAECEDRSAAEESAHAKKVIKQIGKLNAQYAAEYSTAVQQVTEALRRENIYLLTPGELTEEQSHFVHKYFKEKIFGRTIPIWFSATKAFDSANDAYIYLGVRMLRPGCKAACDYAYIELPVDTCGRFVQLPDEDGRSYLMYLDDVVRHSLPIVFEGLGYTQFEAYAFKFTRDAEMEIDNDLRTGMMQKIAKGVKTRKRGEPLRVIYDKDMPRDLLRRVLKKLDIGRMDTIMEGGHYQNHKDLMSFPDCGHKNLRYEPWPSLLKKDLDGPGSLLQRVQEKDRFLHVPYHSFDSFIRLLQEAAVSKQVTAINISLYRLAKDSKVVKALIGAARNGKKVTVVIELLARFDEASNIYWSKRLQEAGAKVIFGVEGLKVHSKIVHLTMKKGPDIACIGTGNFHEGNARTYTDCMLMTAAPKIVKDVAHVFEFIERPYNPYKFKELLVSPNEMKSKFVHLINDEIRNKRAGKPAYIKIKINHITDPVMVTKLYEASQAGVDIRLSVRGNCALVTDVPGISHNIKINGIIDRYLEHSRIFVFAAGGEEKVFIGSADWMPRNLDYRVEVVTPVYDPEIKGEMVRIVDYALSDTSQGRIVDGRGRNALPDTGGAPLFRSQEALYKYYKEENENQPADADAQEA